MGYVVRMPQLGMSMEEGTLVEWRVDQGDAVEEGATVAVVESEKTQADVEAREDGVLRRIIVEEGTTVEPGDPIGVVAGPDEDVGGYVEDIDSPATSSSTEPTTAPSASDRRASTADTAGATDAEAPDADVRATPGARQLADEEGIDLDAIEGTGPQGVVTEDDVSAHRSTAGGDRAAVRTVTDTRPLSSRQRTIAERLGESYREAVHVTLNRSFDTTALVETRDAARDADISCSLTDLLIKAVSDALTAHPAFNAVFEDGDHNIVDEVNVGVAIDLDDGLVTPVIPDTAERSVEAINEVRRELTDRVQSGDFTMDDLEGGTFTISNLGVFGVDDFDPIINPPEIAILGVGRIRDDGTMTLSLSFDHRVVNGADAARFLDEIVATATDRRALSDGFEGDVTPAAGGRAAEEREVHVELPSGFAGIYRVAGREVAFDEPTDVGGTGTAPTPVEHLLGALGACLSAALREMARRDGVDLDVIACDVDGTPDTGPLSAVDIRFRLDTGAGDEAVERALTKAERSCFVERALSDDVSVSVSWTRTG